MDADLSDQGRLDNYHAIELYNQAVDKTGSGQFDEAVNLTEKALSVQPNFTLALITRTSALLELNRINDANLSLQKALTLAPDDAEVLAVAASYHLKSGKNSEALQFAQKAVIADPSLIEAWIIKGTAHGNLGEYYEEISASNQALNISPDNKLALENREYASRMLNQDKKTPLGIPALIFSLLCSVFIILRNRI
ncbi:MAG: tetratricopeptide repeat protein [Candidatus Cloacimonetes bacterium]|nr:tetratricopeptide repeat protein [Candidatus Cloacimonadota bacterium]